MIKSPERKIPLRAFCQGCSGGDPRKLQNPQVTIPRISQYIEERKMKK